MKRMAIAMLSIGLVSGVALAADKGATSPAKGDAMAKDAMSKDAMANDSMTHGAMSAPAAKSKHPEMGKTKAGKTHEPTKDKGAM